MSPEEAKGRVLKEFEKQVTALQAKIRGASSVEQRIRLTQELNRVRQQMADFGVRKGVYADMADTPGRLQSKKGRLTLEKELRAKKQRAARAKAYRR